jgi:hypothetical protein
MQISRMQYEFYRTTHLIGAEGEETTLLLSFEFSLKCPEEEEDLWEDFLDSQSSLC